MPKPCLKFLGELRSNNSRYSYVYQYFSHLIFSKHLNWKPSKVYCDSWWWVRSSMLCGFLLKNYRSSLYRIAQPVVVIYLLVVICARHITKMPSILSDMLKISFERSTPRFLYRREILYSFSVLDKSTGKIKIVFMRYKNTQLRRFM